MRCAKFLDYQRLRTNCCESSSSLRSIAQYKGPSIYGIHKKIRFLTPSLCPHAPDSPPPLWTSTCGQHKLHIALLKRLVQRPSGPKAEIRRYDCTVVLVIYITYLYHQKISTFIPSKDEILVKKIHQLLCTWDMVAP